MLLVLNTHLTRRTIVDALLFPLEKINFSKKILRMNESCQGACTIYFNQTPINKADNDINNDFKEPVLVINP